jgi:ABC-type bacteriocin/lantibiotic exporter with double-glycine peptidase domain
MAANGLKIADFGVHTLKEVNIEIPAGQRMGLSGPSGSGKTLLLRAIADLDPHQGQMWLDGVAAETIAVHQWRRQVGLLPAESAWWHDTVGPHFSNVVESWVVELGFSLDVLKWQIDRLSSGERQRLALLRLLMLKPKVLLLDEPTTNLDAKSIRRVEHLLNTYCMNHQPVVIWVSHDKEQLKRNCSAILTIQGDRLISIGEPDPAVEPKNAS